ncbi:DUF2550 domain-containing protein [Corynebacterium mendelii]|uniref:DUF2550 domain-containing protein n=1 Tax=Corynebacterium mendelii TaxID=2765362 RepID=A0A939E1Z1_9CORY|nr:DUF2550 domain-containing protein [Corynebacterium mendelii]MBN9644954.1 DUF2550 domain-containing protein [Corynebacterium mendelii]
MGTDHSAILWIVTVIVATLVLLVAYRMIKLRSVGNLVAVRRLPAKGLHGWRHGVVRYNDRCLKYYKLRSLSPRPDNKVGRGDIVVSSRRELTDKEKGFIDPTMRVLTVSVGERSYEVAMTFRGETALTSWLESAPSKRRSMVNDEPIAKMTGKMRLGRTP